MNYDEGRGHERHYIASVSYVLDYFSVTGFEPGFISPLDNITVAAGRSAHFTCVVKHLGGHKVKLYWQLGYISTIFTSRAAAESNCGNGGQGDRWLLFGKEPIISLPTIFCFFRWLLLFSHCFFIYAPWALKSNLLQWGVLWQKLIWNLCRGPRLWLKLLLLTF